MYTSNGLLGPVRVGPTVGFGAPDGLRFGLFSTWKGLLGAGAALSMVPSMGVPGAGAAAGQVSRFSGEGFLRVHPFRGAFFAGLAGGVARTDGMATSALPSAPGTPVALHTVTSVVYLAPHAGFRWMLGMGMTIGFDAGVELPVASNGPTFDAAQGEEARQVAGKGPVATAMNFVTNKPIPVVRLLEVGYAF